MQWDGTPAGGFTEGRPWLPAVDPAERNVAAQREDRASLLCLYRELISLRRRLRGGAELIDGGPGVLAYRRGDHLVAVNLTGEERPAPRHRELVLTTHGDGEALPPHGGVVVVAE
jgi:alpha-glucosidase